MERRKIKYRTSQVNNHLPSAYEVTGTEQDSHDHFGGQLSGVAITRWDLSHEIETG